MTGKKRKSGGRHRARETNPKTAISPDESKHKGTGGGGFWLYGLHAARAALANPDRNVRRIVATARASDELAAVLRGRPGIEPADPEALARLLPAGAVHQGIALMCDPLPARDLETTVGRWQQGNRRVVVLDQITDPQNEGAILRTSAAFGVAAVVVQDRHAGPESGALAKAASGALDIVPRVAVVNIARALNELGALGFWRVALAGDADTELREATRAGDTAIVLGAEGTGIRRLVRENCDVSAYIPINRAMESLNVSNAAAVALYELGRSLRD